MWARMKFLPISLQYLNPEAKTQEAIIMVWEHQESTYSNYDYKVYTRAFVFHPFEDA